MARILIVDDNAHIRHLMRFYFEQAGHVACGEAENGVEAIQCVERLEPDLILLDLTMPVMSGIETAAVLKRIAPSTPIILFTLHEDSINREYALMVGVDLVVDKSQGIPKLAEAIKTLLRKQIKTLQADGPKAPAIKTGIDDIEVKPDPN